MSRKRITQIFPFLIPIRIWQRNLFFNIGMHLDKNKYSKNFGEPLAYTIADAKTLMINENSGYDIVYQENKVYNLKMISKTMNHVLIQPKETFSFCYLAKHSGKYGTYKDGLVLVNNKIVPTKGGGICHLSNLLYYVFLMSPLTIVERHGHKVKSFPNPDQNSLEGIDATIRSGWLDLKVRNNTDHTFQIEIDFDEEYMYARILSDQDSMYEYRIINENFQYIQKNNDIYESVSVIKIGKDKQTGKEISKEKLYDEVVKIEYELPKDVKIIKEK